MSDEYFEQSHQEYIEKIIPLALQRKNREQFLQHLKECFLKIKDESYKREIKKIIENITNDKEETSIGNKGEDLQKIIKQSKKFFAEIERYIHTLVSSAYIFDETKGFFFEAKDKKNNVHKLKEIRKILLPDEYLKEAENYFQSNATSIGDERERQHVLHLINELLTKINEHKEAVLRILAMRNEIRKYKEMLIKKELSIYLNRLAQELMMVINQLKPFFDGTSHYFSSPQNQYLHQEKEGRERASQKIQQNKSKEHKVRVLLLTIGGFIPSGVVTVTKQLVRGFQKENIPFLLVSHWIGAHTYELWEPPKNYLVVSSKNKDITKVRYYSFEKILQIIKEFKPTIIHVHSWSWADSVKGNLSRILQETENPPLVFTLHTPKHITYDPQNPLAREIQITRRAEELWEEIQVTIKSLQEKHLPIEEGYRTYTKEKALWSAKIEGPATEEIMQKADALITILDAHKESIARFYPHYTRKTITIHNVPSISPEDIKQINEEEANELLKKYAPNNEKLIVYIGRIERLKGIKIIGETMKQLWKEANPTASNYKFIAIGGLGGKTEREEFYDLCKIPAQWRSEKYIEILGWTDNIKAFYKALQVTDRVKGIILMPIGARGLLTVMEGAISGVPVMSWKVDPRIAFITYPTPHNIINLIHQLFDPQNVSMVKKKLQEAQTIIRKEYSLQDYIKKHIILYRTLLERK